MPMPAFGTVFCILPIYRERRTGMATLDEAFMDRGILQPDGAGGRETRRPRCRNHRLENLVEIPSTTPTRQKTFRCLICHCRVTGVAYEDTPSRSDPQVQLDEGRKERIKRDLTGGSYRSALEYLKGKRLEFVVTGVDDCHWFQGERILREDRVNLTLRSSYKFDHGRHREETVRKIVEKYPHRCVVVAVEFG